MKNLKSFIVIDNDTNREYTNCTFYQDGVVCYESQFDEDDDYVFLKNGDFTVKEIDVNVIQESFLFNKKVEEIYKRISNENFFKISEEVDNELKTNYSKDYDNNHKYDYIDRFYNGEIYRVFEKINENLVGSVDNYLDQNVDQKDKVVLFAHDVLKSTYRFIYSDQVDKSLYFDWMKNDIDQFKKSVYLSIQNIDDVNIGLETIKNDYNLDISDLIDLSLSRDKIIRLSRSLYDEKNQKLRELSRELAMKEID